MVLFAGVPRLNGTADGDFWFCGYFHFCGRSQGLCQGEHLDLHRVVRHLPRIGFCHQLLWESSPETPLELGGFGNADSY